MSEITPSQEQSDAIEQLVKLRKPIQTLGGYAGTGKTTAIRTLLQKLPNFAVCAFTGKAAQVLVRKGIPAKTIHSLIYIPEDVDGTVSFHLRGGAEWGDYEGIIIDEASMVNDDLYNDLLSFGLPLIFVGDHGQLEPVGASTRNLMKTPDITLEKIHRNAGDIAHFAEYLRKGGLAKDYKTASPQINIMTLKQYEQLSGYRTDQMICAYNRTRVAMNSVIREHLGFTGDPQVGDRIMCLQNNRQLGLFNGMQGNIDSIDLAKGELVLDTGETRIRSYYSKEAFGAEKIPQKFGANFRIPFDFSYCITCHKAQGDEWDSVTVIEQQSSLWEHNRWTYTAASRAKKQLNWIRP